jgi:hypothetical protein
MEEASILERNILFTYHLFSMIPTNVVAIKMVTTV